MKRTRNLWGSVMCLLGVAGFVLLQSVPPPVSGQIPSSPNTNVSPFDFANSFYNENGTKLSLLAGPGGRVGVDSTGTPCTQTSSGRNTSCNGGGFGFPNGAAGTATALNWVTDTSNTDPTRTSTRILQTTGGFDMNGNLIFYSIMGTVNDDRFFDDADCPTSSDPQFDFTGCGSKANTLANQFRAFIEPKQLDPVTGLLRFPTGCTTVDTTTAFPPPGIQPNVVDSNCAGNGIVFSPAPPNRRQDNIFDTVSGYFCKNLQGLWILTFAVYTPNAYLPNGQYASSAAQAAIAPIAAANGTNLDGTAVLERTSEIDSLTAQGFLNQLVMPRATHAGAPRYVV